MKFAAFSLFKCDCFIMLQKELGALTEPPQGSVRNERNAVKLCRTGKPRVTSVCWVIWIISVNMFRFIFPGKERGGGALQHKGKQPLPLLVLNPFTWVKPVLQNKYGSEWLSNKLHIFFQSRHHLNYPPKYKVVNVKLGEMSKKKKY